MGQLNKRKAAHCFIFRASWRGTSLKLRIEADDLDIAQKRAETAVRRMEGAATCMSVDCIKQEY